MRTVLVMTLMVLTVAGPLAGAESQDPQHRLLREGKLALLDGRLQEAVDTLRDLQRRFPEGHAFWNAVFFEARALERLERKEDALGRYEELVERAKGHSLAQQAHLSVIELSVSLFDQGIEAHIDRALAALQSSDEALRQVAALRLSYLRDRDIAGRAVPVLRQLASQSADAEVRNQATVALLRIDPELLRESAPSELPSGRGKLLRMILDEEGQKITLSFPLSLARLLIDALPEDALEDLKSEGFDARQLIQELDKADGVIEIRSEGTYLKIWIE